MLRLYEDSALAIAAHILTAGPISRAGAGRDLDLSAATLTRLVRPLVDSHLVNDSQAGTPLSGIGRPTQLLEIPASEHHFIGVNLTADVTYGVLTDARANPIVSLSQPLDSREPEAVAHTIDSLIDELCAQNGAAAEELDGIGISAGGHIAHRKVIESRFLGWQDVDLPSLVKASSTTPTYLLNDIVALTTLEQWFGLGRSAPNFLIATVGAGIGHGIVHNRRAVPSVFEGYSPTSHLPLARAKGLCQYGHVGCANGVLTTPAVLARASGARSILHVNSGPDSLDELIALAEGGDPTCQFAIAEFGTNMATYVQTVAGAAMVIDVILDGEAITLLDTPWASTFTEHLAEFKSPNLPGLNVHTRSGTFDRWARGAATGAIISWLESQVTGA
ncbi:MAG: ROK family protein [Ancrocorticia sp.]|uniref:ROK family protein n=1 Tax=Ancrocorticia sp. TaxID=2593684 RepID=UPI003F8F48BE